MNIQEPSASNQARLESWKEIGAYLQRDSTTARRWEKEEGLPVHRHSHKSRASVYAYPSEINAWRAGRKVVAEAPPVRAFWRWPAFALTMLLSLIMVGNGVRPVSAQQAGAPKAARQVWVSHPGEDPSYASVSADGRYITFTDWETGDLGIRDLKAGTNRRLTHNDPREAPGDYAQNSIFSTDGRQIAYNWFIQKDARNEVRVVPAAGGRPRTVWRSEGFNDYMLPKDWSRDGRLVVVHILPDHTSQLALLTVQDGSTRALKSFSWQNFNASLSPDGRLIAYDSPASEKTQARDIFVIATDGSRESAVVQNPASDAEPIWSPDGSQILFLSDRTGQFSLWSVPFIDGKPGEAKLVRADLGRVEDIWMTRSGTLYYIIPGTASPNIYSAELGADMKVTKPPVLAVQRFVNSNNGPALSPDGQYLAYESFRPGSYEPALVIQTIRTGEERTVPAKASIGMMRGIGPMWFPDGRSLLMFSRLPQGPGPSFYRIDATTGNAELLHRTSHTLDGYRLSPDGRTLFYTEQTAESNNTRLVSFDIETRRETELKTGENFMAVAVSPDGKQLAYLVQTDGPASYLAVIPAAGGTSREVLRRSPWVDGSRYTLAWTPDQRYLLFVRGGAGGNGPNQLWRVPVSGGPAEQMGLPMAAANIASPQIHPDGKRVFFASNTRGPNEVWALENFLPKAAASK